VQTECIALAVEKNAKMMMSNEEALRKKPEN
jgi:predicted nucleic acid-binding protein